MIFKKRPKIDPRCQLERNLDDATEKILNPIPNIYDFTFGVLAGVTARSLGMETSPTNLAVLTGGALISTPLVETLRKRYKTKSDIVKETIAFTSGSLVGTIAYDLIDYIQH